MANRFKAVLFDLGSTLLYFDGAWPEVFSKADHELCAALLEAGFELDQETFTTEFRKRLEDYYEQREAEFIEHTTAYVLKSLLGDLGYKNVDENLLTPSLEKMYAVSQSHWKLEPEAVKCLETLKARGFRLVVISNAADDADVQTLIDNHNIREYFEFVLSSAACGIRKPNPQIFEIALEKLMISADEAVMVGDKLGADILGAINANIYSVWDTLRADIPANRDHLDTIQPDATISSLGELASLLDSQ